MLVLHGDEVPSVGDLGHGLPSGDEEALVLEHEVVTHLLEGHQTRHSSQGEGAHGRNAEVFKGVLEAGKDLMCEPPVCQVVEHVECSEAGIGGPPGKVIEEPMLAQERFATPPSGMHLAMALHVVVLVGSGLEAFILTPCTLGAPGHGALPLRDRRSHHGLQKKPKKL